MFPRRKLSYKRRRRRLPVLVLLALVLVAAYVALRASDGGLIAVVPGLSGNDADSNPHQTPSRSGEQAGSDDSSAKEPGKPAPKDSAPDPEQATPEAAAYAVLAPELPGTTPESIKGVYRSKMDKSWASVRADEPNYAKNDVVSLSGVPEDLIQYLYPENAFAAKVPEPTVEKMDLKDLPKVDSTTLASTEPVMDGVPEADRERVQNVLGEARQQIEGYHGVAGLYVRDLDGGFGYGIRPDETFFTASIIKVPVMVAVYRKIDEGDLSFSQQIEIKDEDWAAGAGWLQWEKAGTKQTVGDLLLLMMTQSDNVAANALVRTVGGPEKVNEVARSMGADDTLVYQKISSERGAVPSLDNRSTPRDMVTMMQKIAEGKAASEKSCGYMIDLMHEDKLDWWLDAGLPEGVDAANKAGWLYKVYDEVGIVEHDGHRYVVAILSKHGSADVYEGQDMIENLSKTVWESQTQEK